MLALVVGRKIAARLDLDSARLQRFLRIQHKRQRFIIDIDQPDGVFGHVPVDCGATAATASPAKRTGLLNR